MKLNCVFRNFKLFLRLKMHLAFDVDLTKKDKGSLRKFLSYNKKNNFLDKAKTNVRSKIKFESL